MVSETTPLTGEKNPNLAFLIRRRTRQFQCCVCALLLALITSIAVITISYMNVATNEETNTAIQTGIEALRSRDDVESNMILMQSSSPSYRHQMSTATTTKADGISRAGFATYHASRWLAKQRKHNSTTPLPSSCPSEILQSASLCPSKTTNIICSQTRYRSINGSCNNLHNSNSWGVAFTKFRRLLPPSYADGVGEPRGYIKLGVSSLPSASEVSELVHRPVYQDDPNFTIMLAVWGQFMDHDITATALSRSHNGRAISCCYSSKPHPECFPVYDNTTSSNDLNDLSCKEFVRSAPAASCCFGPREQLNQASSYLDGSVVYGAEEELAKKLRTFRNGQLRMFTTASGRELLPVSKDPEDGCNREEMSMKNRYCFLSGDGRANENLHLTTMHLLWARQHNRIAKILSQLNPKWTDERLYQESRHIIAAQIQHITYAEFLPEVLGKDIMLKHDLLPQSQGYYYGYNSSIDATIANSFASAAFRFAHTLIPGLIRMLSTNTSLKTHDEYIKLHEMLFNPFRLYDDELDVVLEGAFHTPIEASDPYFSQELKGHLFERGSKSCGLDLVALNIQRGRDHGLAGYPNWREFSGLTIPQNFEDLSEYIDSTSVEAISSLYSTINDVDLYTGALSERPLPGSLVGPTASFLITDQFIRLKTGDRFWYESPERPQSFNPQQLEEIRKITLASLICDNGDFIKTVPQWVMRQTGVGNEVVSCEEVGSTDLTFWKEN